MSVHELDSQQRIREAVFEELEEKGVLGLRIADIASKAEVSVALVYKLFGDRDELLSKALGELIKSFYVVDIDQLRRTLDSTTGPVDLELIASFFALPSQDERKSRRWMRVKCLAAAVEIPSLWKTMNEIQTEYIATIEALALEVRARNGAKGPFASKPFAHSVTSSLLGLIVNDIVDNKMTDEEYYSFMVEYLRHHLT